MLRSKKLVWVFATIAVGALVAVGIMTRNAQPTAAQTSSYFALGIGVNDTCPTTNFKKAVAAKQVVAFTPDGASDTDACSGIVNSEWNDIRHGILSSPASTISTAFALYSEGLNTGDHSFGTAVSVYGSPGYCYADEISTGSWGLFDSWNNACSNGGCDFKLCMYQGVFQ